MGYRPLKLCRITNPFGAPGPYASRSDEHGPAGHHTGIDFGKHLLPLVPIDGRVVRSSTPGVVMRSEYDGTLGNWVAVYYRDDNVLLSYWHLSSRAVKRGDTVARGQILGRVGNTGNSSAPHLHVQANRGWEFDYHGHIAPGPWVRGPQWAGRFRKRKG